MLFLRTLDGSKPLAFSRFRSYTKRMQFRVPQNITMEDRIAGPLTAIQFGIVVIGGLASFLIFTSTSLPSPLNQALGAGFALFTLLLAVGKFNDQPMYRFIRYIILFIISPKTRVWRKTGTAEPTLVSPSKHEETQAARTPARKLTKSDIAGLAAVVDSRGQYGVLPPEQKQENK